MGLTSHEPKKKYFFIAINKRLLFIKGQNQGVFMIKAFIICSLFFSFYSYGRNPLYYQKMAEKRQKSQSEKTANSADLENLAEELQGDIKNLLFTLAHEHTSEEEKLKIITALSETTLFHEDIISSLNDIVARGRECENEEEQTACRIIDIVALSAQAELIRKKTYQSVKMDQESWDHQKDIVLNSALIVTGVGLLLVPGGNLLGVALLTTTRAVTVITFTSGSAVTGIGLYHVGREIIGEEDKDINNIFEFVKGAVAVNILTKAIFHFAQIGDAELLEQIVFSSSKGEVIDLLYSVIEDAGRSDETRSVAIESLLAFPEDLQIRRTQTIRLLKEIVDTNPNDLDLGVRISAVKVLGKIGERFSEVAEYLVDIGKERSEETEFLAGAEDQKEIEDELRLIALVQSGRNEDYLDRAMQALLLLIEEKRKRNKNFPNDLEIHLEIPKIFLDLLLSAEVEKELPSEKLKNYIFVLKEFILSEIIDTETKLKFSEILIHWTNGRIEEEEAQDFLKKIWTNPVKDILLYVEQLEAQNPTQENKPAFEFLQGEFSKVEKVSAKSLTKVIKLIINKFDKDYPHQKEISEKVKIFIEDYKKMQESRKN